MNFQEKILETTADLRARAATLANVAVTTARTRAQVAATALTIAGRELNKVARRHATRFVKENSTIAVSAGKDVSALARATYATLMTQRTAAKQARKAPAARKRGARKAA